MPNFTVAVGDPLWRVILRKYHEVTKDVPDAIEPDNKILVGFDVLAVGANGQRIKVKGVKHIEAKKDHSRLELAVSEGSLCYEAAQAFAVENGGQPNLGRVLIHIRSYRLDNIAPNPKRELKKLSGSKYQEIVEEA